MASHAVVGSLSSAHSLPRLLAGVLDLEKILEEIDRVSFRWIAGDLSSEPHP
jgi:hypothetical protein